MLTGWTFFRSPSRVPLSMLSLRIEWQSTRVVRAIRIRTVAEIVHAHTKQPDWPAAGVGSLQQLYSARRQERGLACRRGAMTACNRREIRVANLDGHRAGVQALPVEPARGPAGHFDDFRMNHGKVGQILGIRVL